MIKFDHEEKIIWYGLQSFLQEGEFGGLITYLTRRPRERVKESENP